MDKTKRRNYSAQFKREAVELASAPDQTVNGVAANLGINPNMIHRWRREMDEHGRHAFVGQGVARDEEVLAQVKKERDFLKSAAYFAKDGK